MGFETARALAVHFGNWAKLAAATAAELEAVPDIGAVVARSIADWKGDAKNKKIVAKLLDQVSVSIMSKMSGGRLSGRTLVVTGTLATMSREEAEEKIRQAGGKAGSTVSRKTSYVVVGENPGSKADRAGELNVPILNEKEFLRLLAG